MIFIDGGQMGALIRAHDWATSPLGLPETWPQSLRSAVGIMLANKHLMFVAWGPELSFLYNDGYLPVFGTKHPDALGRPFREVWPEIWDDLKPLIDAALSGESTWSENLPLVVERNGYPEEAWFTFSYSPIRDETGAIAGMFCAGAETTQTLLAERRLIDERERQKRMLQQMPGFAALLTGPEHRYEYVNDAYRQISGDRNFMGQAFREVFPDIAGQGFYEIFDRVYESGEPFARRTMSVSLDREDGDRSIDLLVEPVRDNSGKVTGIFVGGFDITERVRAEGAVRESEARFRNMADHAPTMMWVTDAEGRCTYLNRAWYDFTGQSEAEGEGFGWLEAVHPDDRGWSGETFVSANANHEIFRVEYRLRRHDGEYRWAIDAASPRFGSQGDFLGYIGTVIDIDDRREMEDALRDTSAHQILLINELNHRVKNTLATVQSIAMQTFRDRGGAGASPEQRELFESRLIALAIAHDVLTRENWESAQLRDVVLEAVAAHCGGDVNPFTVEGPEARLTPKMALGWSMALHELCTNAVKYGALSVPDGTVAIRWSVEREEKADQLNFIWEERGGPSVTEPSSKGFGSRLIERQLARELGGHVELIYAPKGVNCTIKAPLSAADDHSAN
ncbi:PAS domain-containing sensor histidine kinase [Sphingomonas prati]|uniref:histidine kinase n=2 Tax=Sphingomonas prati TaxID=1843237 RepID=A0A7W9F2Z3_9SPHN|nr:PAS domain S-box protein [Sphingomonas prati]MBB5730861.1 PAS domain S-box-containing protein [Sphingomonas prati]GGE97139.1 histidine kinase [Sphingomonas prati]